MEQLVVSKDESRVWRVSLVMGKVKDDLLSRARDRPIFSAEQVDETTSFCIRRIRAIHSGELAERVIQVEADDGPVGP